MATLQERLATFQAYSWHESRTTLPGTATASGLHGQYAIEDPAAVTAIELTNQWIEGLTVENLACREGSSQDLLA